MKLTLHDYLQKPRLEQVKACPSFLQETAFLVSNFAMDHIVEQYHQSHNYNVVAVLPVGDAIVPLDPLPLAAAYTVTHETHTMRTHTVQIIAVPTGHALRDKLNAMPSLLHARSNGFYSGALEGTPMDCCSWCRTTGNFEKFAFQDLGLTEEKVNGTEQLLKSSSCAFKFVFVQNSIFFLQVFHVQ